MNPLFYKKPIIIDKYKHSNWGYNPVVDFLFAKNTNILPIVTSEFEIACKEYPIVFVKNGDSFSPVLLLSLKSNNNSFVDNDGKWLANYIPAYIRRYPFILAENNSKNKHELILCIDSDYSGFSSKKSKLTLFDTKSEPSDTLKQAITLVNQYQVNSKETETFCNTLNEMGLLKESTVVSDSKKVVEGFYSIEQKAFDILDNKDFSKLRDSGYLSLIFAHFVSLRSVNFIA